MEAGIMAMLSFLWWLFLFKSGGANCLKTKKALKNRIYLIIEMDNTDHFYYGAIATWTSGVAYLTAIKLSSGSLQLNSLFNWTVLVLAIISFLLMLCFMGIDIFSSNPNLRKKELGKVTIIAMLQFIFTFLPAYLISKFLFWIFFKYTSSIGPVIFISLLTLVIIIIIMFILKNKTIKFLEYIKKI